MQGKLFQRCTYLLNSSVLSLGGNVHTRRLSKPDMGSIFHKNNQWNTLVIGNYYINYQNYQNLILLSSSDTKQTLRHLFLLTNSAQRELASICTQSIRDRNKLSLHLYLAPDNQDFNWYDFIMYITSYTFGLIWILNQAIRELLWWIPCYDSLTADTNHISAYSKNCPTSVDINYQLEFCLI